MVFELRIPYTPFTGSSYRPRTHIVEEKDDFAICNFKPKQGWDKIVGKKIEDVECKNCQRTYIRYMENLFGVVSKHGWNERLHSSSRIEA